MTSSSFSQYLTKLKRLLPTFFEDFDSDEIEKLIGNSTLESVLENWDSPILDSISEVTGNVSGEDDAPAVVDN